VRSASGCVRDAKSPSPSCPYLLLPHVNSLAWPVMTATWCLPHETWATESGSLCSCIAKVTTCWGEGDEVMVLLPSSPLALSPQDSSVVPRGCTTAATEKWQPLAR